MSVIPRPAGICIGYGVLAAGLLATTVATAHAQRWEMRVCAAAENFPISDRGDPGFENRVAGILAEDLGADVRFHWTTGDFDDTVANHLLTGRCDVIMGVGEGVGGLLNTVPYYRSPYVFAFRDDAGLEVGSLDDERLRDLRISTYAGSVQHGTLLRRGLGPNVVTVNPLDPEPDEAILQRVLRGEADVGLLYGPRAGFYARHVSTGLRIVPVSPELDPPLSPMFSTWTIGLRPHDDAFRDLLNVALARRWDDIQEIFEEFGVPLLPVPRPRPPGPRPEGLVRIGIVLPMPAGGYGITDVAAGAARAGAMMTEGWLDRELDAMSLDVVLASAPDSAAASRAAQRLASTEGVTALVGGLGRDQALALSDVARGRDILFLNIGSPDEALRAERRRHTFHVEASASGYLDALIDWFAAEGNRRWFIVAEATSAGRALGERALRTVAGTAADADVVGVAEVPPENHVFHEVFDTLRDARPDVVLLLLSAGDQESFLSQYERTGLPYAVTGVPDPVSQTRDFYSRFRQVARDSGAGYRVALWETSLSGDADELNARFMGRTGEPMDPMGWAAFAAVKIVFESVVATGSREASTLVDHLEGPRGVFDLHKGEPVSFDPADHQLRQPLYIVKIARDAEWGPQLSSRVDLAELIGRVPIRDSADPAAGR